MLNIVGFKWGSLVISVILIFNNFFVRKKTSLGLDFSSNFIQERFYALEITSLAVNLALLILRRDVLISENDVFNVFLRFHC